MSSMELAGHRYILYLEGSTQAQIHPSAKGMVAERSCHVGQGSISDKADEEITRFTFRTDRPTGLTPHGLAHLPDFERLRNGDTWEEIHEKLMSGWPPQLVDAYCTDLLDQIENWQKEELRKGKNPHQILIPYLVLSRLRHQVLEAGFPQKAKSTVS